MSEKEFWVFEGDVYIFNSLSHVGYRDCVIAGDKNEAVAKIWKNYCNFYGLSPEAKIIFDGKISPKGDINVKRSKIAVDNGGMYPCL